MKEFLFDPKGAERVTVKTIIRTVWGSSEEAAVEGWLTAGKDGRPAPVYFMDSASIASPPGKGMTKIDFKAACKARYAAVPKKGNLESDDAFRKMEQTAIGAVGSDDLALAAWLYRLGDEKLAAQALVAARKGNGDPRKRLRDN